MDWWVKGFELLGENWALGVLVILTYASVRVSRWIGSHFIAPLGGPDGKISQWLDAQRAQHVATREAQGKFSKCLEETSTAITKIGGSLDLTERRIGDVGSETREVHCAVKALVRAKLCIIRAMAKMPGNDAAKSDLEEAMVYIQGLALAKGDEMPPRK